MLVTHSHLFSLYVDGNLIFTNQEKKTNQGVASRMNQRQKEFEKMYRKNKKKQIREEMKIRTPIDFIARIVLPIIVASGCLYVMIKLVPFLI